MKLSILSPSITKVYQKIYNLIDSDINFIKTIDYLKNQKTGATRKAKPRVGEV